MTTFDTSLLPPEDEEAQLPLFRPVWQAITYELGLLTLTALVVSMAASGVVLSPVRRVQVTALLALLPVGLWLFFSWRRERAVQQPRPGLLQILLASMLVANAVAAPIIENVIMPGQWLNSASGLNRILGYTLTVGLATEFLKYLVLRYMSWPRRFRRRVDSVAYSRVIGLGFATVFNLRFALLEGGAQPGPAMIHIVSVVLMQEAIGLVVAHALMNLKLGRAHMYNLSVNLLLGGLLHGLYAVVRAGVVVRGLGIGSTANSPLLGLIFSVIFAAALFGLSAFLINNDDTRDERRAALG